MEKLRQRDEMICLRSSICHPYLNTGIFEDIPQQLYYSVNNLLIERAHRFRLHRLSNHPVCPEPHLNEDNLFLTFCQKLEPGPAQVRVAGEPGELWGAVDPPPALGNGPGEWRDWLGAALRAPTLAPASLVPWPEEEGQGRGHGVGGASWAPHF
uniref:Uncharacterized protein n=1 Tax=Terrapene triunguis TaxID=2587831 RepID=A0A674KAH1_9SAUR